MRLIDFNHDEVFYSSAVFDAYFGDLRLGVFDIETTGLSAERSKIVLGGILTPDLKSVRLRQFFSEGGHEESELLDLYAEALSSVDVLFSYNGNHFDIPFTNARLARHHRPPVFGGCLSLDMYRIISSHSDLRAFLPNLKQKTVEDYLGLWRDRQDRISGADSVSLYYEYMATKKPELLQYILLHNSDDLLQLARILRIFDKLNLHKILAHTGFPVKYEDTTVFVDKILLRHDALEFSGRYTALPFDYVLFDEVFQASFENDTCRFRISVPCRCRQRAVFADLHDLNIDAPALWAHPACRHGYLILKRDAAPLYDSINCLVRSVLQKLLSKF
jgi:uncharacterized protein YprB with RNaseH-like and TPR domain